MSGNSVTALEVADEDFLVASLAEKERPLSHDWTEVVLFGNDVTQDTVKDPYNGDPEQDAQWLATYLYHRFYRISAGVKITLFKGTNKLDGNRQFLPVSARLGVFEKSETVELSSGLKIHYLYDAPYDKATGHNKSISGAIASAVRPPQVMLPLATGRKVVRVLVSDLPICRFYQPAQSAPRYSKI
jgi:hypothetical protein